MELFTVGRENPGLHVPLIYIPDYPFEYNWGYNSRFRLIMVDEGTGIVNTGTRRELFVAPAIFCLNETEIFQVNQGSQIKARSLFFHPCFINSIFDFQNIRVSSEDLSVSASQDLFWLKPFVERNHNYFGHFQIGLASAKRINFLMQAIGDELKSQNPNWICRSRSFFLELLFLLERVFSSPNISEKPILPDEESEIDRVILYLNDHYQHPVSLGELTEVFHTNRTTLMKQFRQATGMSIKAYHNKLRIDIASIMIRDTLLPISEVMERVGFVDLTHFGRTFQRFTGYTPSEYRRLHCWMLQSYPEYQE